jgi:hypothetical protein
MELCCDPELVSRRLEAHKGPLNAVNRDGTISERYCRRRAAGVLCRAYVCRGGYWGVRRLRGLFAGGPTA